MSEGVTGIDYGTVTVSSENSSSISFNHNLGVKPSTIILFFVNNSYIDSGSDYINILYNISSDTYYYAYSYDGPSLATYGRMYYRRIYSEGLTKSSTNVSITLPYSSTSYPRYFTNLGTYHWICIA